MLVWLLTLIAGVSALLLAEFGAPRWAFIPLLGWLLTLGLPSFFALIIVTVYWRGPSFLAYLTFVMLLALVFQIAAIWMFHWMVSHLRSRGKA